MKIYIYIDLRYRFFIFPRKKIHEKLKRIIYEFSHKMGV